MVLGLIAIAVDDELATAHWGDDATLGFRLLTLGGPALFLTAQAIFMRQAVGAGVSTVLAALGALAVLALATSPLPLVVGITAASARARRRGGRRHGPPRRRGGTQPGPLMADPHRGTQRRQGRRSPGAPTPAPPL